MKTINTIADFKRALTVGTKVATIYHCAFAGRDENKVVIFKDEDKGTREVSIVQSNSFALKTMKNEPVYGTDNFGNRIETGEVIVKEVDSWCQYPKSKDVKFYGNNTVTILEPDTRNGVKREEGKMIPVLTYTFID